MYAHRPVLVTGESVPSRFRFTSAAMTRLVVACVLLASLTGCDPAPKSSHHGLVVPSDAGSLPVSAEVTVELHETGAESVVIATGGRDGGGSEVLYLVEYFAEDIDEAKTYAVVARIEDDGTLLYVTDAPSPVSAVDLSNRDGEFEVDLVVVPAGG